MSRFLRNIVISFLLLTVTIEGFWFYRTSQGRKTVSVTSPESTSVTPPVTLKFAVMSDVHSDLVTFNRALAQAKADNVQFVIITGDLTTVGESQEFINIKKSLDESELKYYVVPGNHDHWLGRKISDDLFTEVFGPKYQAFDEGQYRFILIDNGDEYKGIGTSQMAWIKQQAKDCPQLYCLVFMHEPLNHPTSDHIMGEQTPSVATESAKLKKLLVAGQIKGIFAGHLHSSFHYTKEGLTTTIIGAASMDRNWQTPRFVVVTLTGLRHPEEKEVEVL